jgi:hypothetical protein
MRKAIAMIELIFAIVIMGIILMSAPMLVSTATQSGYVAIQQEGINEAASQVNMILGHSWDENNTDESLRAIILTTTNGDAGLNEVNVTDGTVSIKSGRRAGTPVESYRRFTRSDGSEANASAIGSDAGEVVESDWDDMDDYSGTAGLADVETVANRSEDYIETTTIDIARTVRYTSDSPSDGSYNDPGGDNDLTFDFNKTNNAAGTTNIKRIEVSLTSGSTATELDKNITLHAFSCNIGSYELEER